MFSYCAVIRIVMTLICLTVQLNAAQRAANHARPSTTTACVTTSYIFGKPFSDTEKSVIVHKLGFSQSPDGERIFDSGSDCVCRNLTCERRQSEFCIPKDVSDDYVTRTRKSYPEMNPYLRPVGIIFSIDMEHRSEQHALKQLSLVIRTCYPWLAVLCSFYDEPTLPQESFDDLQDHQRLRRSSRPRLYPWLRECCDAVVLPSRRFTLLNRKQVMHRHEDDKRQDVVFTTARFRYSCNKCGVARTLLPEDLLRPDVYQRSQMRPNGKRIPIAARHRDAYLHLAPMNPPRRRRVNVTGGFESTMIEYLAQSNALNFTYFYMGNASRWNTGGGAMINGTYNGMLDLLSRRRAILAVSNQKPFHPAEAVFTFTASYDVDILPFASRIEIRPVTINRLFKSFGQDCINLLLASTACFGIIAHLLLGVKRLYVRDLLALMWFFAMRLFQNGFSMAILEPTRTPPQVKWMIFLWGILALVFNSMFNGVWVTFTTTPPFKGVFDDFNKMKDYLAKENATAYMSPGLLRSAQIYDESLKVLFERGQASSDSEDIIEHLRHDKPRSFWLYDKIYLTYELNKHDSSGTLHISSEYFLIQQQCWVVQKRCALEANISSYLDLFREAGLFLRLKKQSNVLELPPRAPDDPFKPVTLAQLRETMIFVVTFPIVVLVIISIEIVGQRSRRRVAPADFDSMETGSQLYLGLPWEVGADDPLNGFDFRLTRRKRRRLRPRPPAVNRRDSRTGCAYRCATIMIESMRSAVD